LLPLAHTICGETTHKPRKLAVVFETCAFHRHARAANKSNTVFVISFLVQCNPPLVGKDPLFADLPMRNAQIRLTIKIEVQS
jgi:hypothetical protein